MIRKTLYNEKGDSDCGLRIVDCGLKSVKLCLVCREFAIISSQSLLLRSPEGIPLGESFCRRHSFGRTTIQNSITPLLRMLRAYAKINLGLLILEKRSDGYHNIETVFHKIDLFDEIEFSKSSTISVQSSSDAAPGDETNICYKAARLLQEYLGVNDGVRISIMKNIPVGAGLGGGSSDAATVLRELPKFWNQPVDEETLRKLALQLGSDVPFFLGNSSALGKGRGEALEYFDLDVPYSILLCNPNIHVSTVWAYKNITPNNSPRSKNLKDILLKGMQKPLQLVHGLRNDFEPIVFHEYPEVMRVKEAMLRGGAVFASMSGSGSSVHGFFSEADSAAEVSRLLKSRGYKTFLTRPHFKP